MLRLSSVPGNFAPRLLWLRWALCLAKVQLALWLVSFTCAGASADVGVVLNESLDQDVDRISSTGHSAIYFSRICPESPVRLRLCGPGEHGSVMSNYLNIGEDQQYRSIFTFMESKTPAIVLSSLRTKSSISWKNVTGKNI